MSYTRSVHVYMCVTVLHWFSGFLRILGFLKEVLLGTLFGNTLLHTAFKGQSIGNNYCFRVLDSSCFFVVVVVSPSQGP